MAAAVLTVVLLAFGSMQSYSQSGLKGALEQTNSSSTSVAAYTISLSTDSQSYTGPQFVSISGAVSPTPTSSPAVVIITVVAPDGTQVEAFKATASASGSFAASFVAGGDSHWTNGVYTVRASYSGSTKTTTFQWNQPPATTFSIFWITDTQYLSDSNEGLFANTTSWIVNHWGQYDGRMVIHTGDIVQTANVMGQWDNASEAMSVLLKNQIPYTWNAGNHDDLRTQTPSWLGGSEPSFNTTNVQAVVDRTGYAHWVSSFHGGMDTAVNFTGGNSGFLIVNIEWNGNAQVLNWVGGLLANSTYVRDHVIIATHAYIDSTGTINGTSYTLNQRNFTTALTSLMDRYSSRVFLTLNGHYNTDSGYHTPVPIKGRYELMFNRQECTDVMSCYSTTSETPDQAKVGASTVTILTFDTLRNQLSVRSFDVFAGQYRNGPNDQYTLTPIFPSVQTTTTTTSTCTLGPYCVGSTTSSTMTTTTTTSTFTYVTLGAAVIVILTVAALAAWVLKGRRPWSRLKELGNS